MDDGTKKVIGVIVVIFLIIFGVNKCEENEKKERLEEQRRIEAQRPQYEYQLCSACGGQGQIYYVYDAFSGYWSPCTACGGQGQVKVQVNRSQPSFTGMLKCSKCNCLGWPVGLGKNSKCTNVISISGEKCGHKFTEHN